MKQLPFFAKCVDEIGRKYQELDYSLGWIFLYTPAKTLSLETRIVFIGLNPGGPDYEEPKQSSEDGNAYRIGCWGRNGRKGIKSNLQEQICKFYKELASETNDQWDCLMDSTLAANFCPFRSKDWASFQNKKEAIEFSKYLWDNLFDNLNPSVVLCLGGKVQRHIHSLLISKGLKNISPIENFDTGWGEIKCSVAQFAAGQKKMIVVGLPHLSRFGIFGRKNASPDLQRLVKIIADHLRF